MNWIIFWAIRWGDLIMCKSPYGVTLLSLVLLGRAQRCSSSGRGGSSCVRTQSLCVRLLWWLTDQKREVLRSETAHVLNHPSRSMPLMVKPSMFLKLTAQLLEGSEQHSSSECTTGFLVWCWWNGERSYSMRCVSGSCSGRARSIQADLLLMLPWAKNFLQLMKCVAEILTVQ